MRTVDHQIEQGEKAWEKDDERLEDGAEVQKYDRCGINEAAEHVPEDPKEGRLR